MNNKKVKVQITFEWEFDRKEWMDLNSQFTLFPRFHTPEEKVKKIMKQNFEWYAVNTFQNLRNICYPKVKAINIE